MSAELCRSSSEESLPLYNHMPAYVSPEEEFEQMSPLTTAHLQDSLAKWKDYESLLGTSVPSVEEIYADTKATETLARLHTTYRALVASGVRIDPDNGEMPTLLAHELQLVALPWSAFRRYAESPRQLIRDIHNIHQQFFDAAAEQGAKKRTIDNDDIHFNLDIDSLKYQQPDTPMEMQESIASYIDRKIEKEGPWGFMLIQKGESTTDMRQFPITDVDPRTSDYRQRYWAGDTKIGGDSLGILEWSALLAQRTPDEVTNEKLPSHNLMTGLFANPLFTRVENSCYGDPDLPDEPEFEVFAKLPIIMQYNPTSTEFVHLTDVRSKYNAMPYANTGRIAIAADTDPALLDEIIEDGAKLDPSARLPYTWAKRQLESTLFRPATVMTTLKDAGLVDPEAPRLMDILEASPPVLQSLRRLHLAQLYYEGARLESMGIKCGPPPRFQGGAPMGKYSSLELMPWQALLTAAQSGSEGFDLLPLNYDVERIQILLAASAIHAETLANLPQGRSKGAETAPAISHSLQDYLVHKVATEGPWGIALRSLMPTDTYGRDLGKNLFTL